MARLRCFVNLVQNAALMKYGYAPISTDARIAASQRP
jgi:hypothetical protein